MGGVVSVVVEIVGIGQVGYTDTAIDYGCKVGR